MKRRNLLFPSFLLFAHFLCFWFTQISGVPGSVWHSRGTTWICCPLCLLPSPGSILRAREHSDSITSLMLRRPSGGQKPLGFGHIKLFSASRRPQKAFRGPGRPRTASLALRRPSRGRPPEQNGDGSGATESRGRFCCPFCLDPGAFAPNHHPLNMPQTLVCMGIAWEASMQIQPTTVLHRNRIAATDTNLCLSGYYSHSSVFGEGQPIRHEQVMSNPGEMYQPP